MLETLFFFAITRHVFVIKRHVFVIMRRNTDGSKMHNNKIILFFIETGQLRCILYCSKLYIRYLYKVPITWIGLHFLLTTIFMYKRHNTDGSKMHNNNNILFFIETGKLRCILHCSK